jgi:hypothetical protein
VAAKDESTMMPRGIALVGGGLLVLACSADRVSGPPATRDEAPGSSLALTESPIAARRIAELRSRFRLVAHDGSTASQPALGAPVVARFERSARGVNHVHAVVPTQALRSVSRAARVDLPVHANGEVKLEDETSHVSVGFALQHVRNARVEVAQGLALYVGALEGADLVHRVHAEGTEDFIFFQVRPAREELSYSVDVSRVAGLRLVGRTLEFLDEGGSPVLRVAPPYVVDAGGERRAADLSVAGCAYDTSPAGPWGRKVTAPAATRCAVNVSWSGVTYPAMVDPAWVATGSMVTTRLHHTASRLASGRVLIASGYTGNTPVPAELFDPAGNGGVGTFAVTGTMVSFVWYDTTSTLLPSGKVLIAGGGGTYPMPGKAWAESELYDPATGIFLPTGPMARGRSWATATLLASGKVLVAGGAEPVTATAELFDPAGNGGAGSFSATGSMNNTRIFHAATSLPSGKVLVTGGEIGGDITAEIFDPAGNGGAGSFAATGGVMGALRARHTATLLPSGKVLIAGGERSSVALATAEIFNPASAGGKGSFSPTGSMGSMAVARQDFSATLLPSGNVLVTGGRSGPAAKLASAEIFDPLGNGGAGTFRDAGSMSAARSGHTSTTLLSGRVLVTGGNAVGGESAEIFAGNVGDSCKTSGSCVSGYCVDGVCCSAACTGPCQACAASTKQDGVDSGTCGQAKPGASCGSAQCSGTQSVGKSCDVAGACTTTAAKDCAPYACTTAGCPTSCMTSSACVPSAWCDSAKCSPKVSNGNACPSSDACASGFCVDGVCCNRACTGPCERCDATPGTCAVVAPASCEGAPPPAPGAPVDASADLPPADADSGCTVARASERHPRNSFAWLAFGAGASALLLRRRERGNGARRVKQ